MISEHFTIANVIKRMATQPQPQRIIQAALQVQCAAPECKAALVIPSHSQAKASQIAEAHGWRHCIRRGWLCPDHKAMRRIHTRLQVPTHAQVHEARMSEALDRFKAANPNFSLENMSNALKALDTATASQDGSTATEQPKAEE